MKVATTCAPINIATLKYWGKADTALNTPLHASLSLTLQQDDLHTKTTVAASSTFQKTQFFLNGEEAKIDERVAKVIKLMTELATQQHGDQGPHTWPLRIVSENSFPTGAGLASSASGFACLVKTLAKVFDLTEQFDGQFSAIARQGSGSACRSMYGGFVRWEKGSKADGSDSIAKQIASADHWPNLCALVCVVDDKTKQQSSTLGMQASKATSKLLEYRVKSVVEERLRHMEAAYMARDFETFGRLTMQDSNQFHAVCMDTFPPLLYLSDASRRIIQLVHHYNECSKEIRAAYTFDAGANAVIFVEEKNVQEMVALLAHQFPLEQGKGMPIKTTKSVKISSRLTVPTALLQTFKMEPMMGGIKLLHITRVGDGPRSMPEKESLVNPATGGVILHRIVTIQEASKAPAPTAKTSHRPVLLTAACLAVSALAGAYKTRYC